MWMTRRSVTVSSGKGRALRLSQTPSTGTLRPCREESVDWDTTQNLYIEGDNLEVLKLLQKSYHGRVKMIYIDIFIPSLIQSKISQKSPKPYSISGLGHFRVL